MKITVVKGWLEKSPDFLAILRRFRVLCKWSGRLPSDLAAVIGTAYSSARFKSIQANTGSCEGNHFGDF